MGFSAVANFELETKQTRIPFHVALRGSADLLALLMWSGCDAFT